MATLDVQDAEVAGLASVTFTAAASGGDEAATDPRHLLLVRNTDTSAHTLTITTPGTASGIAINDPTVEVAADGIAAVPMHRVYRASSTGRASLSMDDATGVEYALLRMPRRM